MQSKGDDFSRNVNAILIARQYFLEGKTKSEIAKSFGLNRFKVARIVERCLSDGLVEIVFHYPVDFVDYGLSAELKARLGLRHALVVHDVAGPVDTLLDPLGRAAATLLREVSTAQDVLGFAWTRTLEAMTQHLDKLKAKAVVQLCGAFPGAASGRTSVEIVRDVAQSVDGQAFMFYAPLITSDPAAARAILRQPDVRTAQGMFKDVSKAVVTIGAWTKGHSSLWDAAGQELREEATKAGVVAEICGGIFLDRDGRPVDTALSARTIGIAAHELAAIPEVIGVAFGVEKAMAARAAVRGKLVTSLVCHAALAEAMITAETTGGLRPPRQARS